VRDEIRGTGEHAALEIDGAMLEVASVDGEETLSRLFRYEVVCTLGDDGVIPVPRASPFDPAALLGLAAHLTLLDGFGTSRSIHGIVTEAVRGASNDARATLAVTVRPAAFLFTLGRDCRVFHDKTAVDIVKEVLQAGVHSSPPLGQVHRSRWEIIGDYPRRAYCAQYREDDYSFIARLCEEEGIYFWFDHDAQDTTLVFADSSISASDLTAGALLSFAYESGMRSEGEVIIELGIEAQATPTQFSVGSFDPTRPEFKVQASTGGGAHEVYDAPGGGPESPGACEARVRVMREAAAAARECIAGTSSSVRLVPGQIVEVDGHPLLDGRYLVTEATVHAEQRRSADRAAAPTFSCRFRAISEKNPFRTRMDTRLAKQAGLQSGVVVGQTGEEIHPDASGRVRVKLHWDRSAARDHSAGTWMRVAQRGTADSMLLPRIGWNVMTFNEEGDVDTPSVLSRFHDAEHSPAYGLPANMTRVVFKTATTPGGGSCNEMYFEDRKGSEELFINASRDMTALVQNTKTEQVSHDSLRTVGVEHELGVTASAVESIANDQHVAVGANEAVTVGAGRTKAVQGNESRKVGGKRSVSTGNSHHIGVTKKRSLSVGAALIDTTLGPISASSGKAMKIRVGGARIAVSAKSISQSVQLVALQTIGAAKIELATQARSIDAKRRLQETVGGLMILKSDAGILDEASMTSKYSVGGTLDAGGPKLTIVADDSVEIVCGASSITISKGSVDIRTPSLTLAGATIDAVGALIRHN
jgi:type VI secretion system secreted protein VgrG